GGAIAPAIDIGLGAVQQPIGAGRSQTDAPDAFAALAVLRDGTGKADPAGFARATTVPIALPAVLDAVVTARSITDALDTFVFAIFMPATFLPRRADSAGASAIDVALTAVLHPVVASRKNDRAPGAAGSPGRGIRIVSLAGRKNRRKREHCDRAKQPQEPRVPHDRLRARERLAFSASTKSRPAK